MTTYNAPEQRYEPDSEKIKAVAIPYGKVFLFLALGLGIVAGVGYGFPYIFARDDSGLVYLISMILAFIGILIFSFIINLKGFSKKSVGVAVCYFLDAVCWGIALSSVISFCATFEDGARTVGLAFGITAGIMLVMGLFGFVFKNAWKASYIIPFLLLGILVMGLVNLFVFNDTLYWITDFVFFGVVMIETMVDMNRIKQLGQGGFLGGANNLAVYCAYTLMSDYVILLLKIIPYLLIAKSSRR